jgi:hypothetical protein
LGIAACLFAGAARSQDAGPDDLGFKGTQEARPEAIASGNTTSETVPASPKPKAAMGKTALPRLEPYRGAERLGQRGGLKGPADGATPSPTVAALPAPPPLKRPVRDERPFDPLGIRIGGLKLTPFVEEDLGWSSNPSLLPGPQKGSPFLTSQAGFRLGADGPRSALYGDLKGGLTDYFRDPSADTPFANGVLNGRWDLSRAMSLDSESRFAVTTLTADSLGLGPNVTFASSGAPLIETYGATAGGDRKFGRLDISVHGSVDRTSYSMPSSATGPSTNCPAKISMTGLCADAPVFG